MRRHLKASSAFTHGRDASVAGRDARSFATRGVSGDVDGSGASAEARGSRRLGLLLLPLVALTVLAATVPLANAATQRPFKETFGSAAQPSFGRATFMAVDPGTGDVLVADREEGRILRFHADGTPSPFSALGSNFIDGKEENGKPCAEEPASCDKTPENGIEVVGAEEQQIAVDNSGGPTDGNIYVTQGTRHAINPLVDIFASDGEYLGQLTGYGPQKFSGLVCGAAVDAAGTLYISSNGFGGNSLIKYVPTSTVPVDEDGSSFIPLVQGESACNLALGGGPTAGFLFGATGDGQNGRYVSKFDIAGAERMWRSAVGYGTRIAADPVTGYIFAQNFLNPAELAEFDASGDSLVRVGRILGGPGHTIGDGFAVSSSGDDVYVGNGFSGNSISVFGEPGVVPTVTADPASEITGSKALLSGSVDPEGLEVTGCFFEYGEFSVGESTAPCEGEIPTDSEPHAVRAKLEGLLPNGHSYQYRLVAENANGREESPVQIFETATTVVTEAASPIGTTSATLRGTVRPEGDEYSACFFEYGLTSSDSLEKSVPCTPGPGGIAPDFAPHQVSAAIGGLQVGESYRFRLVATDAAGTLKGEELTFTTLGKPRIAEIRARDADQGSVTIEAKINPSGFGTTYHFEWGPTAAYGNKVPADFEPFVGSGTEPVRVTATISGLAAGSVYHYRVVATNSVGATASPDQVLETLNSCGLPEQRCFELVSPREAGPVAAPGQFPTAAELHFQAASNPGGIAYVVEAGFPDSTRGAEVLYRGIRGPAGWGSTQISAPSLVPSETATANSNSSVTLAISPDLSCGVEVTNQPLTADAGPGLVVEAGGSNLYRRNPDGSYTAITKLTPTDFEKVSETLEGEYQLRGMSDDCGKVVFSTEHTYPGVSGAGNSRLYEWDEGELRNLGSVPGSSGELIVPAIAGTPDNHTNIVSADGRRVFFSAKRQTSPNPAENGQNAIFVRENGVSRDLSLSETSTPSTDAVYAYATDDGSRVFFTASAGLTAESSSEGTDLYEYNLETEDLRDLSVEDDQGGAEVGGLVGASEDGSHVYFAARGQLVPGKGKTFAQNQSTGSYSLYGVSAGQVEYAGTVRASELERVGVLNQGNVSSRVSPDGSYLLFETAANVTGYESGGPPQAYLYSADDKNTVCVSCRPDDQPSLPAGLVRPLETGSGAVNRQFEPRTLVIRDGEPSVFFTSRNRLATGAVEGLHSLYQWSHDQVFAIETEAPGLQVPSDPTDVVMFSFGGASADGSDLYFSTPDSLTWEDGDERSSIYDARIGGGFPQPPAPPAPCDPTSEGSCQGSSPQPPAVPGAASTTFSGPGNAKPNKPRKQSKKRKGKSKKKQSNGRKSKGNKQRANGNRRAGK